MLQEIAPDLWHVQHTFSANGMPVSTRMTVVRLRGRVLWLHSPVPLTPALREQLGGLGEVGYIVAPCKMHHLFIGPCAQAYPAAQVYGAPGLAGKRPDLTTLRSLDPTLAPPWHEELEQVFIDGIPIGNEVAFYHRASRTLILTDLLQWWRGDIPFGARVFGSLTGVRARLAVPRTVRWMIKDPAALAASVRKLMLWPFERVVVAHNAIVDEGAYAAVRRAFAVLGE